MKSRFCYKYKEFDPATYKEPRIFRNSNRLCGDGIVLAKWGGGIGFEVVPKASANGGRDYKEIAKLSGTLNSTAMAIPPAPLYLRDLQRKQSEGLCATKSFDSKVCLDYLCIEELTFSLINLCLSNGRSIVNQNLELVTQSDASMTGLGAYS